MSELMDVARLSGRYSQLKRSRPADDPDMASVHRDLVAARLLLHISEILATSPPLAGAQVERIAAELAGGVR
jgi:hypothetical protein